MNRTIKFRGKSFATGKMETFGLDSVGDYYDWSNISQFTGLTDKNGKEIYEFDLVKVKDDTILEHQQEYIQRVEMHNGYWRPTMMFILGNEVEVIGNLYENPDLI